MRLGTARKLCSITIKQLFSATNTHIKYVEGVMYNLNENEGYHRHVEVSVPLQFLISTDRSYTSDI